MLWIGLWSGSVSSSFFTHGCTVQDLSLPARASYPRCGNWHLLPTTDEYWFTCTFIDLCKSYSGLCIEQLEEGHGISIDRLLSIKAREFLLSPVEHVFFITTICKCLVFSDSDFCHLMGTKCYYSFFDFLTSGVKHSFIYLLFFRFLHYINTSNYIDI